MPSPDPNEQFATRLAAHRGALLRFVAHRGRGLLRYESAEDLAQGITLRALKRTDSFEDQGGEAFLAWLQVVARRYIADRHDYWTALRRHASQVVRITNAGSPASTFANGRGVNPPGELTGPPTFAERRERLSRMAQAMHELAPRDRDLLHAFGQGGSNQEIAELLGVSYDAAEVAKRRALERFRKVFERLDT